MQNYYWVDGHGIGAETPADALAEVKRLFDYDAETVRLWTEDDDEPQDFDQIAEAQGWDDYSLVLILREYIANQGQPDALDDFARTWADRENS